MRRRRVRLARWLLLLYNTALREYLLFEEIANPCRESCERVPLRRIGLDRALEAYLSRLRNRVPVLQESLEIDVETDWTSSEKEGPHGNIRIPLISIFSPASESAFGVPKLLL